MWLKSRVREVRVNLYEIMSERQKDQLGCTLILNGDKGGRKK